MDRNEILKNLMLYSIRKNKIIDMKLQLEEYFLCDELNAQGYEERVDTSIKCKNNDELLLKRERISNQIKIYEATIKRTETWLTYIRKDKPREVVNHLCILNKSKSETAKYIDRTKKQVNNLFNQGIDDIYNAINEKIY